MKPKKVRRRLEHALESRRVIQVVRDAYDSERAQGYVLSLTDKWVALHVLADGIHLDGLVLMRLRDISSARDGHSAFLDRSLAHTDLAPGSFRCPDEATTRDLVLRAADLHPLSAFTIGDDGEEVLMIGRLLKAGRHRVTHRFIRTDGTWVDEVDQWRYDQISTIHVGGRYIDALAAFGDPFPDDEDPRATRP